jgi:GT2 family glycosyltransferase
MTLQPRNTSQPTSLTDLDLTVAIPTLGRVEEVIHTLQLLIRELMDPTFSQETHHAQVEILVSDQNDPPIANLVNQISGLQSIHPQLILRHQRVAPRGVVHNMNAILSGARGRVILFLDDDVDFEPRLIRAHLKNYSPTLEAKKHGGVAGRVEQPSGDREPSQVQESGRVNRYTGAVVAQFNSLTRQTSVDFGPGGNMSYLKSALIEAGGFDEEFDGNGYFFEPDLGLRVRDAGYSIVFDPLATLKHLQAPRGGCRITDKAVHTQYFVKNGTRLFRKFFPHSPHSVLTWGFLALWTMRAVAYCLAKSLWNRDWRIAHLGIAGLTSGLKANLPSKISRN